MHAEQARRRPCDADYIEVFGFLNDPVPKGPLAAEQPGAGLHFHDDGFADGGNAWGELKRPGCESKKGVTGRWCVVGAER